MSLQHLVPLSPSIVSQPLTLYGTCTTNRSRPASSNTGLASLALPALFANFIYATGSPSNISWSSGLIGLAMSQSSPLSVSTQQLASNLKQLYERHALLVVLLT